MLTLELLVGNIASGKSTYTKEKFQSAANYLMVNDDSIVNLVHGGNYKLYDKNLKNLYKDIEHSIISAASGNNYNVVVDRPNHTYSMRRRYIGLAKSFDMSVHVILFGRMEPITHAYRRFNSDSRGYDLNYWEKVAKYHDENFQAPNKEKEGFDRLSFYNFEDKSLFDLEEVHASIL